MPTNHDFNLQKPMERYISWSEGSKNQNTQEDIASRNGNKKRQSSYRCFRKDQKNKLWMFVDEEQIKKIDASRPGDSFVFGNISGCLDQWSESAKWL